MMKFILIQLFILSSLVVYSCQQGELMEEYYSLTVKMDTEPHNKLYLFYKDGNDSIRMDSAVYQNGKFELEGYVKYPQRALLRLAQRTPMFFEDAVKFTNDAMFVFLEKGNIQIETHMTLREARLSGTPSNEELQVYTDSIRFYRDWLDGYRERYREAYFHHDEAAFASLSKENQCMEKKLKEVETNFFVNHPKSFVALDWLVRSYNIAREKAVVVSLFNSLDESVKNSIPGEQYRALLERTATVAMGYLAPDFISKNKEGEEIVLSSFRGKYVLLDFWASWCGPCRQENVHVLKIYEQFKNKKFVVLGYSLDSDKKAWLGAVVKDKLPWEQLSGLEEGATDVSKLFGVTSIPSNFLIGPDGKIIGIDLRGEKLEQALKLLLK